MASIIPSPKETTLPIFILFAGFTRHSQILSISFFNNNTSIAAPVSFFCPYRRAGITLVLLSTNVSPGSK